jgi:hypothetical protein
MIKNPAISVCNLQIFQFAEGLVAELLVEVMTVLRAFFCVCCLRSIFIISFISLISSFRYTDFLDGFLLITSLPYDPKLILILSSNPIEWEMRSEMNGNEM